MSLDPTTPDAVDESKNSPAATTSAKKSPAQKILETFCPFAWSQVSTTPMNDVTVCCEGMGVDASTRIGGFLDSPRALELRRALAAGEKPAHCIVCFSKEAVGARSSRTHSLSKMIEHEGVENTIQFFERSRENDFFVGTPTKLDIKLSSICNLQCRMCSPFNSSKIWSEYARNPEALQSFRDEFEGARNYYEGGFSPPTLEELRESSARIVQLNISGGEPFLQKGLREYFHMLKDTGLSKNIFLTFNTNASILNWDILELIKSFHKVEIYISVDGVGPIYEYIRFPAKWEIVAKNIVAIRDYFAADPSLDSRIHVSPTYQALNILDLKNLFDWCESVKVNCHLGNSVLYPSYHAPHALPDFIRRMAAERLSGALYENKLDDHQRQAVEEAVRALSSDFAFSHQQLLKFLEHNRILDGLRKQSFERSCPELNFLIQEYLETGRT